MEDEDVLVLSAEKYSFWHIDYVAREIKMVEADGASHSETLESEPLTGVASSTFDWQRWWLITKTLRNDTVIWLGNDC